MAAIIPPGYAQFSIEHWLGGYARPAVTTMAAKINGTVAVGSSNLADQFHYAFETAFAAHVDSNVTVRDARAVVGQDGGDPLIFTSGSTFIGGRSDSSTAPAQALMLTKYTELGGRRNRGRMYFPWAMAESRVAENGAIDELVLNTWRSACIVFIERLQGDDIETSLIDYPVILHGDATTPTRIIRMSPNNTVRSQRNRQVRF